MNTLMVSCPGCGRRNRIPAAKQHRGPKCGSCGTLLDLHNDAIPVELDDSTLASFVGEASLPVLVDFFSPTCGPCHMMSPIIDSLAKQYFGRAIIAKLDTSRNRRIPAQYRIQGVPTFIFFKNGRVADQITGAVPKDTLIQRINRLV